jgi:hypothetical protein
MDVKMSFDDWKKGPGKWYDWHSDGWDELLADVKNEMKWIEDMLDASYYAAERDKRKYLLTQLIECARYGIKWDVDRFGKVPDWREILGVGSLG